MSEPRPLPCPFCGVVPDPFQHCGSTVEINHGDWIVACEQEDHLAWTQDETREEAIAAWNRRAK